MIYFNGEDLIIVWIKGMEVIDFETEELLSCKYKMRITADEWLDSNKYKLIGYLD